jgi:hypothetical protein
VILLLRPEIELPRPGDVYTQLGVHLVIGQVTPAEITYCVREGRYTGPPRQYPLTSFLSDLAAGLIQKEQG